MGTMTSALAAVSINLGSKSRLRNFLKAAYVLPLFGKDLVN